MFPRVDWKKSYTILAFLHRSFFFGMVWTALKPFRYTLGSHMPEPRNILVRMPNWIGDLVMGTPVLTDLRAAFPKAAITAMCRTPISDLLVKDAAIDELFCFTTLSNKFLRRQEQRNIIAKITAGKFDTAVLLTNSFSSAWWCWQGKVERRIGYSAHLRRLFLTDPVAWPKVKMHQVDLYKRLLAPLGVTRSETAPRLYVSKEEVDVSKQLLFQRGYVAGKRLIGINPGASYGSAKCWPPERFRALALELLKEGYVVFFGDASTFKMVREICQGLPEEAINLAGITSLRELACIIKDCDLLVTNDSGPMHIAAAFGTPLIALFGSTDEEATGPYGNPDSVINKHADCAPCFKRTCPIDFRCMKNITVEEVAELARELLRV
jgi:lipopolysaccharide heptosyltransferase II